MAVLKLRKYISKHTFNDAINFWSNRPWKNPNVGKTNEREGVLLISSILEITSAKIKPIVYLSLLRFPCLKMTGRNTPTATSKFVHTQPYCTDCLSFKCCTIHFENQPSSPESRSLYLSNPRLECIYQCFHL
jgi:hypothetical protein